MLGKMFVINVPAFVVGTYDMIKGWLDIRTQKKIEFLGSGPVATARLLEFIDAGMYCIMGGGMCSYWCVFDICMLCMLTTN